MTLGMDTITDDDLAYLMEQIRSNLSNLNANDSAMDTSRVHAWILTTLAIYGKQLNVLINLYRLLREYNSYELLSFMIEHILQHHMNEIDKNDYIQEEFEKIFTSSLNSSNEKLKFSYYQLYTLLSSSTRDIISSLLIRKWYDELEKSLLLSPNSSEALNQCREKALACLSLSSSSISSILQLIINTEDKIGFKTKQTSLNILRCLFVCDLLPIVLENRQRLNIPSHYCHKWLIYAIEFYLEYLLLCFKNNQIITVDVKLEASYYKAYRCDNPFEKIEKLINMATSIQENFDWQQLLVSHGNQMTSLNRRQKLLELRILIDRSSQTVIRCPLECFIFCTSFPIYVQAIMNLSSVLTNDTYKDYVFLCTTSSIKKSIMKQNSAHNVDLMENFYLFVDCLNLLQQSQVSSCVKLYQEALDKIHLNSNIDYYQHLLKLFYFYYITQKSKTEITSDTNSSKAVIIDDTPQSPTMQDDANVESTSTANTNTLVALDIESLIQKLNTNSIEERLQLCSLFSILHSNDQRHTTVSFCIDTLIYLHDHRSSYGKQQQLLMISSDYCFVPYTYSIFFHYVLDIILQNLSPTLVLLQIEQQRSHSSGISNYPKDLLHTLSPGLLSYIYDCKLLGLLLKYIQTTTNKERRWTMNINKKRKLDNDDSKITDEQFIEKIIQHIGNCTQWTDEQQRQAIYTYVVDQRDTLLHSLC